MRIRKFHLYLTFVMISTGFLISNSIEMTRIKNIDRRSENQWQQEAQLNERIIEEREKNRKLEEQLMNAQRQTAKVEEAMADHQSEAATVLSELEQARMLAGLVQVEGPGVIVTMRDNPKPTSTNVSAYIVHEGDIWKVVNELLAAGAEGISVNGQRLVSGTVIRCVGPTVIVNGVKSAAPFEITAIGDPAVLEGALHLPGGIFDWFEGFVEIDVTKKDLVSLPAFVGDNKG
ncbi:DUF881 domain-containing protein [Brevibacillus dissolubilis]|uniref:DUF881 domain-containing protein n=1 Tax=Brevibacillus dissolubilis TaxID=1844116 RepID=UPI001116D5E9|nr:DUF881 domain-containing protein [Brevibacillus dissolubilis]